MASEFMQSYALSDEDFELYRALVYQVVGISLNDTKKMLLISRLSKRLRTLGLANFREYYEYLKGPGESNGELGTFINHITTNKTDFFREDHHFDLLRNRVLPDLESRLREGRQKDIRIWSAGCSTGEEPYTMGMVVQEYLRSLGRRLDVKILATDIDTNVLTTASEGIYGKDRLAGVPQDYLARYFRALDGERLEVKDELKHLIRFGRFNLMHEFPFRYGFDVIFCRNVMIYFTAEDRKSLVRRFCKALRPQAYLALGHSESLTVDDLPLANLGTTMYQLRDHRHA